MINEKLITNFIAKSRHHSEELEKLQSQFSGAVKLAGLIISEVIDGAGMSKDYFYRRRTSGQLTPQDFKKLLDSFEKKYNETD